MLLLPKTPKSAKYTHRDTPRFRLSNDSTLPQSPQSPSHPLFGGPQQPPSFAVGLQTPSRMPTARIITPLSVMAAHRKRSSIKAPSPVILGRNDPISVEHPFEDLHDSSTVTISDDSIESELRKLELSSNEDLSPPRRIAPKTVQSPARHVSTTRRFGGIDQADAEMMSRPNSEPIHGDAPTFQFRPISADPVPSKASRSQQERFIKKVTICKTPRCARPTKAWLARFEDNRKEPQETQPAKTKSTLTEAERREVWARLLPTGAAGQ